MVSTTIDQKLDDIQKKFPDVEYNPGQFPDAVFRLSKPNTSTLLFRTGKMVSVLAPNPQKLQKRQIVSEREETGPIIYIAIGLAIIGIAIGSVAVLKRR